MPYDFASLAFVNQFITATNDRTQQFDSISISTIAAKIVGGDVQAAAFWGGMQANIEACVTSYIQNTFAAGTAATFTAYPNRYVSNGPDVVGNWTLSSWRAAAGINSSGFKRVTSSNTTAYGTMQAGDVIGDWIFDEMAAGLRLLNKTVADEFSNVQRRIRFGPAEGFSPSGYSGPASLDDNPGTFAAAVARADTAFSASTGEGTGSAPWTTDVASLPLFGTSTGGTDIVGRVPSTQWYCGYRTYVPTDRCVSLPTTVGKSVEFWCVAYLLPSVLFTFDANGCNVSPGAWTIFQTINAGLSATAALPDPGAVKPDNPGAPAAPGPNEITGITLGFQWEVVGAGRARGVTVPIIKWTFTDPPV